MSYDIYLEEPDPERIGKMRVIEFEEKHNITGGTYCIGGTTRAHLNVTYNYSEHFAKVLGENGIRSIYGKKALDTIPVLEIAISKLKDDIDDDYWKSTEGNAREALGNLLALAKMAPQGIWSGD